jgi:hypothetical protein
MGASIQFQDSNSLPGGARGKIGTLKGATGFDVGYEPSGACRGAVALVNNYCKL